MIEFENNNGRFSFKNVVPSDVLPIMQLLEADDFENLATSNEKFLGNTKEIEYLQNQSRLSFSKAGIGDPLCLENYSALGGFKGLKKALGMKPQEIVDEVKNSGLRGRGGAAFPTGIKSQTVRDTQYPKKYVVCNADEGDSGTFADRLLMESDPYQLIEGMIIAGAAVGSDQGYIYLRSCLLYTSPSPRDRQK